MKVASCIGRMLIASVYIAELYIARGGASVFPGPSSPGSISADPGPVEWSAQPRIVRKCPRIMCTTVRAGAEVIKPRSMLMTDTSARPPFRADHVGSLLRPQEVLQAREDFAAGSISAQQLKEIEDVAI